MNLLPLFEKGGTVSNTSHVIRRITFEVQIPSEDKGFSTQETISDIFNHTLQTELEKLLDKLDNKSDMISIDKLEIDLGFIKDNALEQELTGKIRKCLEEKLLQMMHSARMHGTGEIQNKSVTIEPANRSKLNLFIYFLKTGTMPWWARNEERSVPVLVIKLMEESPAPLREALEKILRDKTYRKRFVYQLPDPLIAEIMKLYDRSFPGFAADSVSDICTIHNRSSFTGFSPQSLRWICWDYFITQVLEKNTGSRVTEKAGHLRTLIRQLQPEGNAVLFVIRKARQMQDEQMLRIRDLADLLVISEKLENDRKKKEKKKSNRQDKKILESNSNDEPLQEDDLREQLMNAFSLEDKNVTAALADGIYINNAGLVLVWPYILPFFRKLGLLNGDEFISEEARQRGVHLLQYLVTGEPATAQEHELVLNKILCGIAPEEPISAFTALSVGECDECTLLLENIITNWSALKNISVGALRNTFLVKEGILQRENGWKLKIERTTVDMLIDKLPWSISIIMLPWNNEMIYAEW